MVITTLAAGACGSGSDTTQHVVAAARDTVAASTFRMSSTSDGPGGKQEVTVAQVDLDRGLMAVWQGEQEEGDLGSRSASSELCSC